MYKRPEIMNKIEYRESDIYLTYSETSRLDVMSNSIYNSPKYWWVILHANGYAIEFDIRIGELVRIPYPLNLALIDIGEK